MLTKYVTVGNRLEIRPVRRKRDEEEQKHYESKVYDIISEDKIEILMPLEKTKLILLPMDIEYEIIFYTKNGLYQCRAKVEDRYKNNNIYLLSVEILSNLKKHQRREYYRFPCSIEMVSRQFMPEEIQALQQRQPLPSVEVPEEVKAKGIILDISGGGMRFISECSYEEKDIVITKFSLPFPDKSRNYELFGKILRKIPVERRKDVNEYRLVFLGMSKECQEEIIKFIFEEERRNRKKEQG